MPNGTNKRETFLALIADEAKARHEAHTGHTSHRPLSQDYELIGLLGEVEFAKQCGVMVDLERRLSGDRGVDFVLPLLFTIDIKTALKPHNLIHEVGKKFADIYVLAGYDPDNGTVTLMGWELGVKLREAPTREFGHGIENHYIAVSELRPMITLFNRVYGLKSDPV